MDICRDAVKRGGLSPAAANSANEEANRLFCEGRIGFLQIGELVREAVKLAPAKDSFTVEDIEQTDAVMRDAVNRLLR